MKFNQITIVDNCRLTESALEKLKDFSIRPLVIYNDYPANDNEIKERISNSDCVLISWKTMLNSETIRSLPGLKYIGMCCSLYDEKAANVDIVEARKQGIIVKGVKDYGDEGTVEFIFAQLIFLFQGLGKYKWRSEPSELKNKKIGIIGFGTLGHLVAKTAVFFGMEVFYFSRTRKTELENDEIKYLPKIDLLETCDIITLHLPKNTIALSENEFKHKKKNSVLINTSLGLTFDKEAFLKWIRADKTSFAIFDSDGVGNCQKEFQHLDNVIISGQSSGFTDNAKLRLSAKVLENISSVLTSMEINSHSDHSGPTGND